MKATIKKVAKNGQVSLPPKYRGMNIVIKESKKGLFIEPLYWDEDLEVFLSPDDFNEIKGEKVWSSKEDSFSEGMSLSSLGEAIKNVTGNDR